jgi:hypothetical protein
VLGGDDVEGNWNERVAVCVAWVINGSPFNDLVREIIGGGESPVGDEGMRSDNLEEEEEDEEDDDDDEDGNMSVSGIFEKAVGEEGIGVGEGEVVIMLG